MVIDYHARQFDGGSTACDGRNCAAASCAMAIFAATGGAVRLTSDQVRTESGVSCVPGAHSPSGGLFISDVIRVAAKHGVTIDYGIIEGGGYTRWTQQVAQDRLSRRYGAIFLGDYDQLPAGVRASSFMGDHSVYAHDYRASDQTVCWHDPLRSTPIRVKFSVLVKYWQKPTSPIRGYAGFVLDKRLPDTATQEVEMVYSCAGRRTATLPKGEPYFESPGGRQLGTIPDAAQRFDVIGQNKATVPTHVLIDGATSAGREGIQNAWVRVGALRNVRSLDNDLWIAGRDAAAQAAAKVTR